MRSNSSLPACEAGLSLLEMDQVSAALGETGAEMHGLVICQNGRTIGSRWWPPYSPRDVRQVYSVSKSFTATAIGLVVEDGLLGLEDPVLAFFPGEAPAGAGENLRAMRVRHLLTMATGHGQDTLNALLAAPDGDWVRAFFACPVTDAPGSRFVYNSGASYMLAVILERVAGAPLDAFLRERLFDPLGFSETRWERCPGGHCTGGWGLHLRLEDLARFGCLYLNRGVWEGRRLLSAEWVDAATGPRQDNTGCRTAEDWTQGYGYQFWRCTHGAYRADGAYGQFCVVLPAQNAVVAIYSEVGDDGLQRILDALWRQLLPRLEARSAGDPMSACRGSWQLAKNALGLTRVELSTADGNHLLFCVGDEAGRTHAVRCGHGEWVAGTTTLPACRLSFVPDAGGGHATEIIARYGFAADGALVMEWRYPASAHRDIARCTADGTGLAIELDSSLLRCMGRIGENHRFSGTRL